MANYPPLKNYMFYCLDRIILRYGLLPPFLDIGCGIGDISRHAALKGWYGKAIDSSDIAIEKAKKNLAAFTNVSIEKKSLSEVDGNFKTIFLMDVLEHIKDESVVLEKIFSLLFIDGYLVMSVPSNTKEWRWDDDFYGHYRRYTIQDITIKLASAGFRPVVFWDFTYPVFWIMRRLYTRLKPSPENIAQDKLERSLISSAVNAWDIPFCSNFLSKNIFFWNLIYKIQFTYFKDNVQRGHQMLILAEKNA